MKKNTQNNVKNISKKVVELMLEKKATNIKVMKCNGYSLDCWMYT